MEIEREKEKEQLLRGFEFFTDKDLPRIYDTLTHVVNREAMEEYIDSLIKRGVPFAMCLLDIDNFKYVNDTYGHLKGDVVLTEVSHFIADVIDDKGVVGRYGGDEFVIILEGISEYNDVWEICHTLNVGMREFSLKGITGLSVTVTIGISRFPFDAASYNDLFALADKVLYRGKMKGRNCFIIYLEEKHKNLNLKREQDKGISGMALCAQLFKLLTETDSITQNVGNLFKYLVSYYMFDHICLETPSHMNVEVMHVLAKNKTFNHINVNLIRGCENADGFAVFQSAKVFADINRRELGGEFQKQRISSALYCKIAAYGKDYGYIRVDMTDTSRVWQAGEMELVIMAANTLALMLHYRNLTIDDIAAVAPVTIGVA
jgi:diguanylate cyclase (GGDEF)-like protein